MLAACLPDEELLFEAPFRLQNRRFRLLSLKNERCVRCRARAPCGAECRGAEAGAREMLGDPGALWHWRDPLCPIGFKDWGQVSGPEKGELFAPGEGRNSIWGSTKGFRSGPFPKSQQIVSRATQRRVPRS